MSTFNVEKGCTPKRKYVSRTDARKAARRTANECRERMNAYRCPECGFYHVGHKWTSRIGRIAAA